LELLNSKDDSAPARSRKEKMMRIENKVALITGGASGMGEATAILFAKEKAKVIIADIDGAKGEEVARRIKKEGGDCAFVKGDVSKVADVKTIIDVTIRTFKKLDVLFNNAGMPMAGTELEKIEESLWDDIMNVNLKSIFLFSKYAVPFMKKQGGGVIINTASASGVRPRGGNLPYAVSKGGAITLTRALALELAPFNIRVNSISPVATDTPMLPKLAAHIPDLAEAKKGLIATIPLGRLAKPMDVAYAALFLASDESSMITGINLEVDGGRGI
jgi:3-oxoacyl-[acyl-carrier protein] reductase